jgi:hypothetical protein
MVGLQEYLARFVRNVPAPARPMAGALKRTHPGGRWSLELS